MFDQLVDGFRKASETSLQVQQEMFRHLSRLLTSLAPPAGASPFGNAATRKQWIDLTFELLNKHREALDSNYKAGIQLIEQAFHITEAKPGDEQRKQMEDLWRKLFEVQKEQAEQQFRDAQVWFQKTVGLAQEARA